LLVQVACIQRSHLIFEGSRWLVSSRRSDPHVRFSAASSLRVQGRVSEMTVCRNFARGLKNLDEQTSRPLR